MTNVAGDKWAICFLLTGLLSVSGCGGGGNNGDTPENDISESSSSESSSIESSSSESSSSNGSSSSDPGTTDDPTFTLEGTAVNGPLDSADVAIYSEDGRILGTTTSNASGEFFFENLSEDGPYLLIVSGGSYAGTPYTGTLEAHCSGVTLCGVTPYSTVIAELMATSGFNREDASAAIGLPQDPFLNSETEGFDLEQARLAIDGGSGLEEWVDTMVDWVTESSQEPPAGFPPSGSDEQEPPETEAPPEDPPARFSVDSTFYSASPVTAGDIPGFGYSYLEMADISNAPGRMWYSNDGCYTLKPDGTGTFDTAGFPGDDLIRFDDAQPFYQPWPGRDVFVGTLPANYNRLMRRDFDRTDYLHPFQWGVRIDDDGEPQVLIGDYIFYFLFEPPYSDKSGTHSWPEGSSEPKSFSLDDPLGRRLSNDSVDHPYCMWREETGGRDAEDSGFLCKSETTYSGNWRQDITTYSCYGSGVLQGDHRVEGTDGGTLLSGSYSDGKPSGTWELRRADGTLEMRGRYVDGERVGLWKYFDEQEQLYREVTFEGNVETEFGLHESVTRIVSYYNDPDSGSVFMQDQGNFRDNRKSGWHSEYDREGRLSLEQEFDAETTVTTGRRVCNRDDTHCEDERIAWLKTSRAYAWHCDHISEVSFDRDGEVAERTCYEFGDGPASMPGLGASKECPSACPR